MPLTVGKVEVNDTKSLELEIIQLHRELIQEREYSRKLEKRIQHLERLGEEID